MNDLEAAILRSAAGCCVACGVPAEQVDHFKPRHAGGPCIPENLCPLCELCNKTKSCMWPGHGYHPMRGHNDPAAATRILTAELEYLEDIYGESRLLEAIGPDVLELGAALLEDRSQRRDARRTRYLHLIDALSVELGDRAYDCWCHSWRYWDWSGQGCLEVRQPAEQVSP